MEIKEIKAVVDDALNDDRLRKIIRAIFIGYDAAEIEALQNHDKEDRKTILGFLRRAKIHSAFRALGQQEDFEAETLDINSMWNYVTLKCDNVVVTVASVYQNEKIPRPAKYRENLAQQLNLFEQPKLSDDPIWVLITHKPGLEMKGMYKNNKYPQEIRLTVLDALCKDALYERCLMSDFPDVIRKIIPDDILRLSSVANQRRFLKTVSKGA